MTQADAFSYGVVLWELITKEQTSRGNWRPVRVPEECPAAVEQLIADCLTDDVERRPSMKEVVERLMAVDAPPHVPASTVTDSAKESSWDSIKSAAIVGTWSHSPTTTGSLRGDSSDSLPTADGSAGDGGGLHSWVHDERHQRWSRPPDAEHEQVYDAAEPAAMQT